MSRPRYHRQTHAAPAPDNDRAHHHDHHDHHDHDRPGAHRHVHAPRAGVGHNGPRPALQWQTLHQAPAPPAADETRDLDLVEASFVEGFTRASDVTSFLRLAGIAFLARDGDGRELKLLRVEIEDLTDVAALTPLLGGAGHRYDPLPTRFTSRRRRLAFAYFDGEAVVHLTFAKARALTDETP